jgi:hypothetical protein
LRSEPFPRRRQSFGGCASDEFDEEDQYADVRAAAPDARSPARVPIEAGSAAPDARVPDARSAAPNPRSPARGPGAPESDGVDAVPGQDIPVSRANAMLDAIIEREDEKKEKAKLEAQLKRTAAAAAKAAEKKAASEKAAEKEAAEKEDAAKANSFDATAKKAKKEVAAKADPFGPTTKKAKKEVAEKAHAAEFNPRLPCKTSAAKAPTHDSTPGKKSAANAPTPTRGTTKSAANTPASGVKKSISHEKSRTQYLFRGTGMSSKVFKYGEGREWTSPESALSAAKKWSLTA